MQQSSNDEDNINTIQKSVYTEIGFIEPNVFGFTPYLVPSPDGETHLFGVRILISDSSRDEEYFKHTMPLEFLSFMISGLADALQTHIDASTRLGSKIETIHVLKSDVLNHFGVAIDRFQRIRDLLEKRIADDDPSADRTP